MKKILLMLGLSGFMLSGCVQTYSVSTAYPNYIRYYDPIYDDYYYAPRGIRIIPGYTYRSYVRHTPMYQNVHPRHQREFGYRDSYRHENLRGDRIHYTRDREHKR